MTGDLHVVTVPQLDSRLGRQVVHDPQSRRFAVPVAAVTDPATVPSFRHRIYDPHPRPRQHIGLCTGAAECVQLNTRGNRVKRRVLTMADAERNYRRATQLDPWDGAWPPDDTGSSGLAAAKASVEFGWATRYEWFFGGAAQVLAGLRHGPVSVGTWWTSGMFAPNPRNLLIEPTGRRAGGHQYTFIGWHRRLLAFELLCWWGPEWGDNGIARIRYNHADELLADDGDAHRTYTVAG